MKITRKEKEREREKEKNEIIVSDRKQKQGKE